MRLVLNMAESNSWGEMAYGGRCGGAIVASLIVLLEAAGWRG